jgi:hypothetical protein
MRKDFFIFYFLNRFMLKTKTNISKFLMGRGTETHLNRERRINSATKHEAAKKVGNPKSALLRKSVVVNQLVSRISTTLEPFYAIPITKFLYHSRNSRIDNNNFTSSPCLPPIHTFVSSNNIS